MGGSGPELFRAPSSEIDDTKKIVRACLGFGGAFLFFVEVYYTECGPHRS